MAMKINPDECTACGDCKPVCPTKSISSGKIFYKIDARHLHGMRRRQRYPVVRGRLPGRLYQRCLGRALSRAPGVCEKTLPALP